MNQKSMSGWFGLGESESGRLNYGGPTLCPAFGQLVLGGFKEYLKLILDSRVIAGHQTN